MRFFIVGALMASCAARSPGDVFVESVSPGTGVVGSTTGVVILGTFMPMPRVSFAESSGSHVDTTFSAQLGGVELLNVVWMGMSELAGDVPGALPVGAHDLVVTGPSGKAVLANAFVVSSGPDGESNDGRPPGDPVGADGHAGDGLAGDGLVGDGFVGDGLAGDGLGDGLGGDGLAGDRPPGDDDGSVCSGTCECIDQSCDIRCPSGCSLQCSGTAECSLGCSTLGDPCKAACMDDATCNFECAGGCGFACSGNSTCNIRCPGGGCELAECSDQAGCLLHCGVVGTCTFACSGVVTRCGDGVWACRRSCP